MPTASTSQIATALEKSRGLVAVAARSLGIPRMQIYRRLEKSPRLRELVAEQRELTIDVAELKLFQAIEAGEPWAIALVVKTLGRDRGYVEATHVDVYHRLSKMPPQQLNRLTAMNDEELLTHMGLERSNGRR